MTHTLSIQAFLTYGVLTCSLIALWLSPTTNQKANLSIWNITFLLAIAGGLIFRFVSPIALIPISIFCAACFGVESKRISSFIRASASIAVIGLSLGFMLHIVPGFHATILIESVQLSHDSLPYSKYLGFDKILIGFFIIASGPKLIAHRQEWRQMFATAAPFIPVIILAVFSLGLLLECVRLDIKCPSILWAWIWTNLFFTCIPEEALCRGFIQRHLEELFLKISYGRLLALVLAAGIFGLMHFAGGIRCVILATVSGLGYGFVYQRTQRIEASIIIHFLLNLAHILFLSYPALLIRR
jgi:uncharacterized protein